MIAGVHRYEAPASRLGSLHRLVGYLLRRAELRMMADLSEGLAPLRLRPTTFSILVVIADRPGIIQSQLCEILAIQHANFVPLVTELAGLGFVERRPATADRRQVELALSATGTKTLRRAWRIVEAQENRMEQVLGASGRRQVLAGLRALVDDFERPAILRG